MKNPIRLTILGDADHLSGFKYWWLKSVREYRLDVHCARCLIGPYDRRVNKQMLTGQLVELHGDLVYLCGVASRWANNFHAPAQRAEGQSFTLPTYNGFLVHFENAVLLPITPLPDGFHGLDRSFTTCRNYQFAVQMSRSSAAITSS